jgi:O-antigen/teichoic acid export membrane protein
MTSNAIEDGRSLKSTAISGGLWTLLQVLCNKGASLIGTVVLMYLLLPEAFGIANLAVGAVGCVTLVAPFTMGDVLIARRGEMERLRGTAWRICAVSTAIIVATVLVIAPTIASRYQQPALVAACIWACLRPVSDFLVMLPLTELRSRLQFRRIAAVDVGTQVGAACTSVAMAGLGAGYLSILLPNSLANAFRCLLYRQKGALPTAGPRWVPSEWKYLSRGFLVSGIGQYVHGGTVYATPLIIGWFSDEQNVGWYAMAYLLSASINQVISVSIGGVLQPVFTHMEGDRHRQSAAFLRATSVTVAVAMPLCLMQAGVAEPAFALLLPGKWLPAVPMLQFLLIGQCFYVAVSPAMGLLKAQGRFATFLWWQFAQFAVTAIGMIIYGSMSSNNPTLGIVAILALSNVIFAPIGILLCTHNTGIRPVRSLTQSLYPFIVAAMTVGSTYSVIQLARFSRFGQTAGLIMEILLLPLLAGACYLLALRVLAPAVLKDCVTLSEPIFKRLRRLATTSGANDA